MRHLAFTFKCACALLLLLSGCVSSPSGASEQSRQKVNSSEKKTLKIAPPAGTERAETQAREGAVAELMQSSSSAGDLNSEFALPASALGLKETDISEDPVLKARQESKMTRSDAEISSSFGGNELERKLSDVDRTLNFSEEQAGQLKPSYLTVTQRIRNHFAARRFEEALVETNELLLHYPNSSLLWTMKGTLHLRLRNTDLSIASYEKAFEFEPSSQLQAQIEQLRRLVSEREKLRQPLGSSGLSGEQGSEKGVSAPRGEQ
jgi:tetratricopeptide (TPR) repeat protein